jgi:hypothetical protein
MIEAPDVARKMVEPAAAVDRSCASFTGSARPSISRTPSASHTRWLAEV